MSNLAEQFFEKALTAVKGHDNTRALGLLVECIKLKPDFTEAWVVRGNVLHSMDQPFDALLHYDRAIGFNDGLHDAWCNRGMSFADIGMWQAAEESLNRSAQLMPAIEPHINLANMYCTMMRLEDAAKEYRKALEIDPGHLDAHMNLGVTLLGLGQWKEGFKEYECRWRNSAYPPRSLRDYVKWQGEDLNGKHILLYPEQGYGDEIMALRFVDILMERYDATVMVQARSPMLRLARASKFAATSMHGDNIIDAVPIDYSCPLLDVPMVLGLHPGELLHPSYLMADQHDTEEWFKRIIDLPPGLNVGLCWSSGTHLSTAQAAHRAKSIPLQWLKPLVQPGVNLISLQIPREPIPSGMPIIDWMEDVHDFADTAALIENLDLVISVDTAVAHLAGALGTPVWNFVRYNGYWPWLAPWIAPQTGPIPEHSIWYPQMKLLRQPTLVDWETPIARAASWLREERQRLAA